jgi:hypothetical protein
MACHCPFSTSSLPIWDFISSFCCSNFLNCRWRHSAGWNYGDIFMHHTWKKPWLYFWGAKFGHPHPVQPLEVTSLDLGIGFLYLWGLCLHGTVTFSFPYACHTAVHEPK